MISIANSSSVNYSVKILTRIQTIVVKFTLTALSTVITADIGQMKMTEDFMRDIPNILEKLNVWADIYAHHINDIFYPAIILVECIWNYC